LKRGKPPTLLSAFLLFFWRLYVSNQLHEALWAADLESTGTTAPGLKEQAKKAE
jgi:hypothetical protein